MPATKAKAKAKAKGKANSSAVPVSLPEPEVFESNLGEPSSVMKEEEADRPPWDRRS